MYMYISMYTFLKFMFICYIYVAKNGYHNEYEKIPHMHLSKIYPSPHNLMVETVLLCLYVLTSICQRFSELYALRVYRIVEKNQRFCRNRLFMTID